MLQQVRVFGEFHVGVTVQTYEVYVRAYVFSDMDVRMCSEEEIHARHQARREYCDRCPMIVKMIEDENKLRIRLQELEQEKFRALFASNNWSAINKVAQSAFHNFLKADRNDDR